MRLHAFDLMTRCVQRGYAWNEVEPCLVEDLGNGWYEVDVDHASYPRTPRPGYEPPKNCRGLGDMVSSSLSAIGITKQRVEAVVGGPCGCGERAAWLNEAGAKWLGLPPGSTAPPEIDPPAQ